MQGKAKLKKSGENDKNIREFRRNSSEHVAAKAKITDRALARLEANAVDKPWEGWDLRMEIATAPRSGAIVAQLTGAVVHRGDFTLGPIDLHVEYGERIAIVGANGGGKTTLLDVDRRPAPIDAGDAPARTGRDRRRARPGPGRVLGRRPAAGPIRGRERTRPERGPLVACEVRSRRGARRRGRPTRCRRASGRARRSRLLGAKGVNCLVLDEPTNHLDLPAIEQLESALENYTGTLLLVTHDRALLEAISMTRRIEIDGRSDHSSTFPPTDARRSTAA